MAARRLAPAAITLLLVLACGSAPPVPGGSALPTTVLARNGPRIGTQTILAAGDIDTLRALVDTTAAVTVTQLGGTPGARQCSPPYALGQDDCWPGQRSRSGTAYAALAIQAGFCEDATAPRVFVTGRHLVVQVHFSKRPTCHINGTMPLPTAALVSFSTRGLRPGLYAVSFRFVNGDDAYDSDATYLSVPSPPASDQLAVEAETGTALASVIGDRRAGLFSVARVDGGQVEALCGAAVAGTAYLVVLDPDLSVERRQMSVVLAGATPRTCTATAI